MSGRAIALSVILSTLFVMGGLTAIVYTVTTNNTARIENCVSSGGSWIGGPTKLCLQQGAEVSE